VKNINVIFCGLTKNCETTIKPNLINLLMLKDLLDFVNFEIIVVDSSTDNTKDIIREFSEKNSFITLVNEDNLEKQIQNRIERLTHCRNICLDIINQKIIIDEFIYAPLDLDLNLFEVTKVSEFKNIIEDFIDSKEIDATFPISTPYYYDIYALRSKYWHSNFRQFIIEYGKKFIPLSSFLINYLLIFRKQWSLTKIKHKNPKPTSAFGGAGLYKLDKDKIKSVRYSFSKKYPELISEHVYFNRHFNNLTLNTNWIISAPEEHTFFHFLNKSAKISYFFRSLKYDFFKLVNFLK